MKHSSHVIPLFPRKENDASIMVTLDFDGRIHKFKLYLHKKVRLRVAKYENDRKGELVVSEEEYSAILAHLVKEFNIQMMLSVVSTGKGVVT